MKSRNADRDARAREELQRLEQRERQPERRRVVDEDRLRVGGRRGRRATRAEPRRAEQPRERDLRAAPPLEPDRAARLARVAEPLGELHDLARARPDR